MMSQYENQLQNEIVAQGLAVDTIEPVAAPTQEPAATLSFTKRLTSLLFSPGQTFEDVKRRPTWLAPLLILILAGAICTLMATIRVGTDWEQITRDRIKQRIENTDKQMPSEDFIKKRAAANKQIALLSSMVVAAIAIPINWIVVTAVLAFGLMIMDARTSFKRVFSVVLWGNCMPTIFGTVAFVGTLMLTSGSIKPADIKGLTLTNLAAFLPSGISAPLKTLASSIDIFTIWSLVLWSIGFAIIANSQKITKTKTGLLVFGLWAATVMIGVVWAVIFSHSN